MAPKKDISVSANPLPISFKDFAKNPIVGTLFLVLIAISYLYVDIRTTFKEQATSQNVRIEKVEGRLDRVQEALRVSDSAKAVTTTQLQTLQQLGAIKGLK
jgi:fumarate reductase subunit C